MNHRSRRMSRWLSWGRATPRACPERSLRVYAERISAVVAAVVVALILTVHAQSKTSPAAETTAKPDAHTDDPQLYRNATFAFRYQIPYGWVDRTQEIQEGNTTPKAQVLLAVFERPPQATGDTINSAVVFASESAASYPGLKKAGDYLSSLTELVTAKGFRVEGEPYEFEVESRHLLRADFTKTLSAKTSNGEVTMHQCTLVLLAKGQIVSFTFITPSDDQLDELMDGLHFSPTKSAAH